MNIYQMRDYRRVADEDDRVAAVMAQRLIEDAEHQARRARTREIQVLVTGACFLALVAMGLGAALAQWLR